MSTRSTFLDILPREVRNNIYGHVIMREGYLLLKDSPSTRGGHYFISFSALILVCKQTYDEYTEVLLDTALSPACPLSIEKREPLTNLAGYHDLSGTRMAESRQLEDLARMQLEKGVSVTSL